MEKEVYLPELGNDAGDKASISFWHYDPGEDVVKDADLVEMITDKATFNVPCPYTGKLTEVFYQDGDEVKVGDLIAKIEVGER